MKKATIKAIFDRKNFQRSVKNSNERKTTEVDSHQLVQKSYENMLKNRPKKKINIFTSSQSYTLKKSQLQTTKNAQSPKYLEEEEKAQSQFLKFQELFADLNQHLKQVKSKNKKPKEKKQTKPTEEEDLKQNKSETPRSNNSLDSNEEKKTLENQMQKLDNKQNSPSITPLNFDKNSNLSLHFKVLSRDKREKILEPKIESPPIGYYNLKYDQIEPERNYGKFKDLTLPKVERRKNFEDQKICQKAIKYNQKFVDNMPKSMNVSPKRTNRNSMISSDNGSPSNSKIKQRFVANSQLNTYKELQIKSNQQSVDHYDQEDSNIDNKHLYITLNQNRLSQHQKNKQSSKLPKILQGRKEQQQQVL